MYNILYKVKFFDEFDRKETIEHGLFQATSYNNAMEQLSDFYGEKDIREITIIEREDGPLILSEYWYELLKKPEDRIAIL